MDALLFVSSSVPWTGNAELCAVSLHTVEEAPIGLCLGRAGRGMCFRCTEAEEAYGVRRRGGILRDLTRI